MKNFTHKISYSILFAAAYLFSLLPMPVLYAISTFLYWLMYRIIGYRKMVVIQNLSRSFPEKNYNEISDISKQFYKSFIDYFVEMFKCVSILPQKLAKTVNFVGFDIVQKSIDEGKSVIATLGHCGNWELLNILPLSVEFETCALYRPLTNRSLDKMMVHIRARFGVKLVSDKSAARHILSKANKPAMYLFLGDQCPERVDEKYRLPFLHQQSSMYPGSEKIAKATNSTVVYLHITQTKRGHYCMECMPVCENPAQTEETEITRQYIQLLEQNINTQPHSWLWTHKRWKR